ncbi:helix-turn-helix domain-containing protein [Streptomyces sp. AK02-01A]|uniref:TetR/AcrR family transcriptional regulator n=1 Tax=Streptomyces sp. AK02-01A TaxID=3028648 RepID=UPI0029B7F15D|nr:helix-turn-helix domain-containing protein [Streptomyces sp. AK02-01A]MDX3854068.1 helix-turn-helix domain containing protein [Streptomyces sp. AK02-01A]
MAGPRPYNSPRRALTAAATRRDILDAARRLFLKRGYAQVTIADIAREAGTAVKTVYASAGGRVEILRETVHRAFTSSDERDIVTQVRGTTDAAAAIALLAHLTRLSDEEHYDSIAILYSALSVHESAEALWAEGTSAYHSALREIAAHLEHLGALKPGMTVDRCSDVLWFCFGLGAWRTLIDECGWTWDQAEEELVSVATRMLLE